MSASASMIRNALIASILALAACASPPPDERLHSTLWVQSSAEYVISTRQVYEMATRELDAALADPAWTALDGGYTGGELTPAIIVDVDETVLDNSGYTGRMILARQGFTVESWRRWVREAAAPPVPGAAEYLRAAFDRGITVFYVTNRHHDLEDDTRRNLVAAGIPVGEGEDVVLTREEMEGWGRDKSTRREFVGQRHRVLQIVGDDLADFVPLPKGADEAERQRLAADNARRWGTQWFLIPNPMYGSWEDALMPGGVSLFSRPMEEKFEHLDTQ
jgi:5'-nucleotidase (lipoprotein e(P4) family)